MQHIKVPYGTTCQEADFPLPFVLTNCRNSLCTVGGTVGVVQLVRISGTG